MTVTTNTDCASLEVASALIANYVALLPDPGYTLVLTITKCSGTSYEIAVIEESPLTILPEDIGETATIPDGVYSFTLTETNVDITREFACHWVDCSTTCRLADYILEHPDTNIYAYIMGLQFMNTCAEVDCKDYCLMYDELISKLNEDDCGCS